MGGPSKRRAVLRPMQSLKTLVVHLAEAAQQRTFERRMGVSTAGRVYQEGVARTGRVFYDGCQWLPVRRALRQLRPRSADVFVDLGAGKGQALLVAGCLGYGKVIGVEVDADLARVAARNLENARSRLKVPALEVVNADALEWEIPDDTSVVFMFCPFVGDLFCTVLNRIFASYDRCPRDLFLVYTFPFEHNWLVSSGRVRVEGVLPARWPTVPGWWRTGWVIVTYRVIASGQQSEQVVHVRGSKPARRRWSGPNDHRFWVGEPGGEKVYSDGPESR